MKKSILFLLFFSLSSAVFSQNISYHIYHWGYSEIPEIIGQRIHTLTKESGGTIISIKPNVFIPKTYILGFNNQTINSYDIWTSPGNNGMYVEDLGDYSVGEIDFPASNGPYDVIIYSLGYYAFTSINLFDFNPSDEFPLETSYLPPDVQQYLDPSPLIQSDNETIYTAANNLVSSCGTLREAINLIAEFVRGRTENESEDEELFVHDAVTTYQDQIGDCKGFTNLFMALCRAVDIPVRYCKSEILNKDFSIPIWSGSVNITFPGDVPSLHAYCEVYYPSLSKWYPIDPQASLNYVFPLNVKYGHGKSEEDFNLPMDVVFTGGVPIFKNNKAEVQVNSRADNFNNYYIYKDYYPFMSTFDNQELFDVYSIPPTGIWDDIDVTEGPSSFSPGDNVSYRADFTSGYGDTYATEWDWTMLLNHSGGTYTYNESLSLPDLGNYSIWNFTSGTPLPDYEWTRDPVGNIYGEVQVRSTDNNN